MHDYLLILLTKILLFSSFFTIVFNKNLTLVYYFLRENASDVKAKFIIEAANHPTDPEADEVSWLPSDYIYICHNVKI